MYKALKTVTGTQKALGTLIIVPLSPPLPLQLALWASRAHDNWTGQVPDRSGPGYTLGSMVL